MPPLLPSLAFAVGVLAADMPAIPWHDLGLGSALCIALWAFYTGKIVTGTVHEKALKDSELLRSRLDQLIALLTSYKTIVDEDKRLDECLELLKSIAALPHRPERKGRQ